MGPTQSADTNPSYGLWIRNTGAVAATDVVAAAEAAEAAGWDGVFLSDSISWGYTDPWTLLAGIASRTDRIKLGTWITPIPRRQPWQLAHQLATLDRLSNGRVILGGGLGTPSEHTTVRRSSEAVQLGGKYDEALEIIAGLWGGGSFSYEGDYFTVDALALAQTPVQTPRIPIVLGCWWPNEKPFQRGARWDGIMPNWRAMTESGEGPQGEQATGSVEEELRDMLEYYHGLTDEPGEIVLPMDPPGASSAYPEACSELGATWLLATQLFDTDDHEGTMERIRDGPTA